MSFGTAAAAKEPGQRYVMLSDLTPFDPELSPNKQLMRELVLNTYSKPLYEFCKYYVKQHLDYHVTYGPADETQFERNINAGGYDQTQYVININTWTWENMLIVQKYIEKYKNLYESTSNSTGGRRCSSKPSQKRPTARRRRSSKARKARKARKVHKARATRRK